MKSLIDKFIRSLPIFQNLIEAQISRIKFLEAQVFELNNAECDHCKLLQGQLEYERERTTHLLDLLTPVRSSSTQKAVGTKSWSTLQNELERKSLKAVNDREE